MRLVGRCVFIILFLSFADGHRLIDTVPPHITEGPEEAVIFRSDDRVTLKCKGAGFPAVTYDWTKNGVDLNRMATNIRRGIDGTITIEPATASDEGYYQCFAINPFGTALSVTSHLQKAFFDSNVGTLAVTDLAVRHGEPFHIQANPKRSFPRPDYGWGLVNDVVDKNTLSYSPSRRVQIADNGDLYFAYATPEDALSNRIYKCMAYNTYMDVAASCSYTRVTVTGGAQNQFAPTLAFSSEAVTVGLIGEQVSLRCFFSGNPAPAITWTGSRNTLLQGNRLTLNKFDSELTIKNLTASDEGNYTCVGRNSEGENSLTLQLKVEAKPAFKSPTDGPQNMNVTNGTDAVFNCHTEAIPEASVFWLQNGQQLDVNDLPKKFALSNGGKTLTVQNVCRTCDGEDRETDLTVIQCNASNVHGYAFASGYLNVLEYEMSTRTYESTAYNQYLDTNASDSYTRVPVTFTRATTSTSDGNAVNQERYRSWLIVFSTVALTLMIQEDVQ